MNSMHKKALVLAALVGTTAACQELEVTNLNLPDTERALSSPDAVQAVIESSFNIWWGRLHNNGDVYNYFPELADEFTRTVVARGVQPSFEPRIVLNNDPEAPSVWLPRASWDGFPSGAANTNDAIRVIQNGLRIVVADGTDDEAIDQTDRAMTFARIFQGINLGYLALVHDQGAPATEATVIDDPVNWERENMTPYGEIMAIAIDALEEGIRVAEQGASWQLAPSFVNGQSYNNAEVIKFAHTMIARLLVYNARTPEERAAVDWQKVLFHTERGLDFDFGPNLQSGVMTSTGYAQRAHGGWTSTNTAFFRVDPRIMGMTDASGGYQEWLATPRDDRDSWTVDSPDRRIQGPEGPGDPGAYVRPGANNILADRGTYNRSLYALWRRSNDPRVPGRQWDNDFHAIATADENRLYEAEAHLRLGNAARAAELINVTRTRGVDIAGVSVASNLPPVTASGVPQSADCIPKANFGMAAVGQCGTLQDALFYERAIELMGMDGFRAWLDFRGFGFLQAGTPNQMPVPGRYLVSIGLPIYTFGGVGGESASAGPPGPFGSN